MGLGAVVGVGLTLLGPPDAEGDTRELSRTAERQETDAELLRRSGQHAFDVGDYSRALGFFEKSLAIEVDPNALFGIAQSLNKLGKCRDAVRYYERTAELLAADHPAQSVIRGGIVHCAYALAEGSETDAPPPPPASAVLPETGTSSPGPREEPVPASTRRYLWGPYKPVPLWKKLGLGVSGGLFVGGAVSTVVSWRFGKRYSREVAATARDNQVELRPGPLWRGCQQATMSQSGTGATVEVDDVEVADACQRFLTARSAYRASLGVTAVAGVATITFVILYFVRRNPDRTTRVQPTPSGLAVRF
jgi:hypothetical protein